MSADRQNAGRSRVRLWAGGDGAVGGQEQLGGGLAHQNRAADHHHVRGGQVAERSLGEEQAARGRAGA
jgi:hypothetical protein